MCSIIAYKNGIKYETKEQNELQTCVEKSRKGLQCTPKVARKT